MNRTKNESTRLDRPSAIEVIQELGGYAGFEKIASEALVACLAQHLEKLFNRKKEQWLGVDEHAHFEHERRENKDLAQHLGISSGEASQLATRILKKKIFEVNDLAKRLGIDSSELFPPSEQSRYAVMRTTLETMVAIRRELGETIADVSLTDSMVANIEFVAESFPPLSPQGLTEEEWRSATEHALAFAESDIKSIRGASTKGWLEDRAIDWTAAESYLPYQLAILFVVSSSDLWMPSSVASGEEQVRAASVPQTDQDERDSLDGAWAEARHLFMSAIHAQERGDLDDANDGYAAAADRYVHLFQETNELFALHELASVFMNAGILHAERFEVLEALNLFGEVLRIHDMLCQEQLETEIADTYAATLTTMGQFAASLISRSAQHLQANNSSRTIEDCNTAASVLLAILERQDCDEYSDMLAGAYSNHGLALDHLGEHHEAVKEFSRSIQIRTDLFQRTKTEQYAIRLAKTHCQRADTYFELGDAKLAVRDFQRVIAIYRLLTMRGSQSDWTLPWATGHIDRGRVFTHIGKPERALRDYSRAIEILIQGRVRRSKNSYSDELADVLWKRAALCGANGHPAQAAKDLQNAIRLLSAESPRRGTEELIEELAHRNRECGLALTQVKSFAKALAKYETAVELLERLIQSSETEQRLAGLAEALVGQAAVLGCLGEIDKCIPLYDRAIKICSRLRANEYQCSDTLRKADEMRAEAVKILGNVKPVTGTT